MMTEVRDVHRGGPNPSLFTRGPKMFFPSFYWVVPRALNIVPPLPPAGTPVLVRLPN